MSEAMTTDEMVKALADRGIPVDAEDPIGSIGDMIEALIAQAKTGADVENKVADLTIAMNEVKAGLDADRQKALDAERHEAERKMLILDKQVAEVKDLHEVIAPKHGPEVGLKGVPGALSDLVYMEQFVFGRDARNSKLLQHEAIRKTLDIATDNAGADWVPTSFSSQFVADVNTALKLPAAFTSYPMPQASVTYPVEAAWPTAYLVAENTALTAYNTNITESSPTTANVTLTAKKLAIRTIESFEWEDDALPAALNIVRNKLITGIARAQEDAFLNGDATGAHMDSDITGSTDRRVAFDGLRAAAITTTTANVSLATLTANALSNMQKGMGEYGVDFQNLIWIVGTSGWAQLRLLLDSANNPMVATVDKYGPAATILAGEVGKLFGIPIIYSPFMRETLNASGVYDGSTMTKTGIMLVWTPAWMRGDRQSIKLETQRHIGAQATELVATWRGAFAKALGTNLTQSLGYNLTS